MALDGVLASTLSQNISEVNRQLQSPLFSILPEEIRVSIWTYALVAYEDPNQLYPKHLRCNRPGQAGALRIAKELLLTCKAVYLETYELPVRLNPIPVYVGNHLDLPPGQTAGAAIIHKLGNYQFANIQWLELSVQQNHLEASTIREYADHLEAARRYIEGVITDRNSASDEETQERMRRLEAYSQQQHSTQQQPSSNPANVTRVTPYRFRRGIPRFIPPNEVDRFGPKELFRKFPARHITRLTVRLGRTDWWTWTSRPTSNEHLALDPWVNRPSRAVMEQNAQLRRDREVRDDSDPSAAKDVKDKWGMQVGHFPELRLFELIFETFAQKLPQLHAVVECAQTWTFPLPGDFELQWDGKVESSSWAGVAPKEYGYHNATPWLHGESDGRVDYDKPLEPRFEVRTVRFVRRRNAVTYTERV